MIPLSVDWLSLSLRLFRPLSRCPEGHRWAYYSPTNVWSSRWVLYNDYGDKVFTILFQPRSSIIEASRAVLEVANEWLYHGIGINGVLKLLEKCFDSSRYGNDGIPPFSVAGISRVDLAADFCPDEAQADVIRGLNDTRYRVAGKQNGSGFWSTVKSDRLSPMWQNYCPHDMNWGHKTSDVKWKLYYKSKELQDEAGGFGWSKPYIVDMWREVGLDEANVWRLEVSLRNCNNFDFMGEKLTFQRFMHSGSNLFQSLYTSRFQVQENQGHKDKTNDRRVPFLEVGALRGAFKVHREQHLAGHNSCLTLLRHLYNDAMTEQVMISEDAREAVIKALERIIEAHKLQNYFREVAGMDFDNWVEWLRVRGYYFGEEHLQHCDDSGAEMDKALIESGLVRSPDEQNASLSVPNPKVSPAERDTQLRLQLP